MWGNEQKKEIHQNNSSSWPTFNLFGQPSQDSDMRCVSFMLFYKDMKSQDGGNDKKNKIFGSVFCVKAVTGLNGKYPSQLFVSSLWKCYEVQTGSHLKKNT